jgi:hypothetical protein
MKTMKSPPDGVKLVMEVLCVLLGISLIKFKNMKVL